MIFTSYFANIRNLPKNVIPIAICLRPPEGYKGLWYPTLAPDYSIFKRYKRDHDDDWYCRAYANSVLDRVFVNDVLDDIDKLLPMRVQQELQSTIDKDQNWHVALVCYEKSSDFCHRHLVANWLKRNGIKCKEWEN